MEKHDIKIGGVKYHWKYFIENYFISLKSFTEYKANFYSMLCEAIFHFSVVFLFGFTLFELVLTNSSFGIGEFLLFAYLMNLHCDLVGMFWYSTNSSLNYMIKTGDLSLLLIRPMNRFFGFTLSKNFNSTPFFIIDGLFYIPFILHFNIISTSFLQLILFVILFILLAIIGILFVKFLESFSWRFIEAREFLLKKIYFNGVQHNVGRFPMLFFDKNPIILISLSGFSFYYVSMWLVPLLTKELFHIQKYEVIILFCIIIISWLGIYFNWKYGLKNYQAFS